MPSYEAALILRKLPRPETAAVLKRCALKIFDTNGILFGIENLGTRPTPFKMSKLGTVYKEGSYFVLKFDVPSKSIATLQDEYKRDVDIITNGIRNNEEEPAYECTFEQEMLSPAYRQDILEMIKKGRKKETKFEFKTGLDYNPFGR